MAFCIYALNLILPAVVYVIFTVTEDIKSSIGFIIVITLCIVAFILKKTCKDDYLKKHFGYQFRTILYSLSLGIAFVFIIMMLALLMLYGNGSDYEFLVFIICILLVIFTIWFIYRNIKGLIYLSKHKEL
ncbi:MAG: hypothetical protein LBT96_00455 [Campylobacteraceae bacterium]|nr:hypothetical protein [Campylobacteraceae bacterium]